MLINYKVLQRQSGRYYLITIYQTEVKTPLHLYKSHTRYYNFFENQPFNFIDFNWDCN